MEERLLPEDHAGQHAAQAPHVQAVVVHLDSRGLRKRLDWRHCQVNSRCYFFLVRWYLIVHQELGALEVAGGHSDVVLLSGVVELSQTPVYEAQLHTHNNKRDRMREKKS